MGIENDLYGIRSGSGGHSGGGIRIDPGGTVRDHLISALAAISTDAQALAVVDALDAYLEEGPDRVPMLQYLKPNYASLLEATRAERDAALERAERVELELKKRKTPKKGKQP
jgi:hypothetical protein